MKLKLNFLASLFLFLSNGFCVAQDLVNGSYSVGFKYFKTYDISRSYVINNDTISRPLLIHFWYPSNENIEKGNYYFKNYIDLIAIREDFSKAVSEVDASSFNFVNAYAGFAKQRFGIDTATTTKQILDYPVAAQYGIAIAKSSETFPLVIYAPSNSKSAVQNHMICEYLASHGYLVISVGSAGDNSLNRSIDQKSILAQVNDMEFILSYFEDKLKIKYSSLGLMGFSSGGLSTTIFQMKNEHVKAVFSMDGSQEYGAYPVLLRLNSFDIKKTNVPYCLMVNNYDNFSIYPFYNSIISKDKYMFRMPQLDHNGFVSYWNFFDLPSSKASACQACSSYDYISKSALNFFDKYLRSNTLSINKQGANTQTNEYIESISIDNSTITQLFNLLLNEKINDLSSYLIEHQKNLRHKENEVNIMSKMLRDSNVELAIELLLFNVEMHPNSWQAHFELGYTYKIKGDLSLSRKALIEAQNLDPDNSNITELINEIDKL